jgi:hypothetical protein
VVVVAQLVLNLLTGARRSDEFYASVAMELKGLRASRESCTFEEIASVTFAVLLHHGLCNDYKPQTTEQMKERLVGCLLVFTLYRIVPLSCKGFFVLLDLFFASNCEFRLGVVISLVKFSLVACFKIAVRFGCPLALLARAPRVV